MKRLSLNLFFIFCICSFANGQTIPYLKYGVEDGLGNSIAYQTFQDSKGYMWFSTDHGLSRFDGQHFINYTTADGLPTNYIMSVAETSDGGIWVNAYGKGVYKLEKGKFIRGPVCFNNSYVGVIADKEDRLWLYSRGMTNNEVDYIEGGRCKRFDVNKYTHDTLSYIIYDIYPKSRDSLLFASSRGVLLFSDNEISILPGTDTSIYSITGDKHGNLWFDAPGKIISLSANNKVSYIQNEFIKPARPCILIIDDGEGRLWCFDYPQCFFVINDRNGATLFKEDKPVNYFRLDNENNVWANTYGLGVFCYNYPDVLNYSVKDGLADNIITGLTEDKEGKIWVSTLRGISFIHDGYYGNNDATIAIKQDETYAIADDKQGDLVYATINQLFVSTAAGKKQFHLMNHPRCIYREANGILWIARDFGVDCYHNGTITKFDQIPALDSGKNLFVNKDSKGNLWFGTNHGIYEYNGSKYYHYTTADGLSNNIVNGIWEDNRKRMWFTTEEGISILDNGKWVNDSLLLPLGKTMCTCITGDSNGNIWIGTDVGLYLDDGKILRKFDTHTGLAGVEIQKLFLDSKNRLWVGTITGLSRIDLKNYAQIISSSPPRVDIQNVKVNNHSVTSYTDTTLSFSYSQNNIRISYVGIYYKNPQSVTYEYKLSGTSEEWIKTPGSTVEFSSLSPGKYKFMVRAINGDGLYSKTPAVFSFVIMPPFWLRGWFIAVEVVLFMIAVTVLFRIRMRRYKRKEQEKARKKYMIDELNKAKKALNEYTKLMVEKNELLEQLKADVGKLQSLKSREVEEVRVEQLEHLNKTTILTNEDWDKFKALFEEVYKGYFIRLKEKIPDLTQAETRLICLYKLKLDTKEMAGILGISPETIRKSRYLLRKKLDLSEKDDLNDLADSI